MEHFWSSPWATVDDFERDEINLITSWPNHGREEGKAPTELFYEDGKVMWGYDIPSDADPVRWFKLLLLREEDMAEELRQSEFILRGRKMIRETGKSAIDLIADYLRALWQHTLDTIHKARSKSVIAALTFQVVITVPAIWKDYARQGMEEAARRAGILQDRPAGPTVLSFAPEPEAAALATLCERERDIESGDVYVICDAGGGTVTGIKHILKEQWEYGIKAKFKPKNTGEEFPVAIPAEAFQGSDLNDHSRKPFITNGRIHFSRCQIAKSRSKSLPVKVRSYGPQFGSMLMITRISSWSAGLALAPTSTNIYRRGTSETGLTSSNPPVSDRTLLQSSLSSPSMQGDDVFKAEPVRHEFYRTYADKTEFTDSLTETILQCDDDKPPSRRNSSVKELCKIRINRRHVSFNSLEDYMGKNGQHLKKWVYDIEMVPSGASNEFAVIYQGKRLGSEKADIEFQ
ncbi:unnamed protein product [Aspergillus oryzae]|nr:unnamed protein product [Aspergillus oryzae]